MANAYLVTFTTVVKAEDMEAAIDYARDADSGGNWTAKPVDKVWAGVNNTESILTEAYDALDPIRPYDDHRIREVLRKMIRVMEEE